MYAAFNSGTVACNPTVLPRAPQILRPAPCAISRAGHSVQRSCVLRKL